MGIAIVVSILCVLTCVVIHWLALRFFWTSARPRLTRLLGKGIGVMIFGCIAAHLLEIGVFTLGLLFAAAWEGDTRLALTAWQREDLDAWFYSASFYTSLGGDKPPTAGLRLLATTEALTGLILITWTASFLFLLMQESWLSEGGKR